MDPIRIFYSWQADRDSKLCRSFIGTALAAAAERISAELSIEILVESDTSGEPGTPPVTETILKRIDACDIFVADMTLIGKANSGKLLPNPNVMAEYGYARRAHGNGRIALVMNTAFGPADELPFDLRHLRHPTEYIAAPGIADAARRRAREVLAGELTDYLGLIATRVIDARKAAAPLDDRRERAQAMLGELAMQSARGGHVPTIVTRPRLVARLAPFAALARPQLSHDRVTALRPRFVPAGFPVDRWEPFSDGESWLAYAPKRKVADQPNPESQWMTRFVRPGLFEMLATVGYAEDGDTTIGVDGRKLEARVLDAATRLATLARDLDLDGPLLFTAGLEGVENLAIFAPRDASRPFGRPAIHLGEIVVADAAAMGPMALRDLFDQLWLQAGFDRTSPSFSGDVWQGDTAPSLYRLD